MSVNLIAARARQTRPLSRERGYTLLEVLIALIIFSIGMLGIASLQAHSLRMNHGSYQRTQAIFLAYDIMDRLRANRAEARVGSCNVAFGASLPGGDLCATDVNDWLVDVGEYLSEGQGRIRCTSSASGTQCTVSVQWNVARQGGTAVDSSQETANFEISAVL